MFGYYTLPFHKNYNSSSSCHTPVSSRAPSRNNSAGNISNAPKEELSHRDLKNAVEKRDVACLFCWDKLSLQGAHIIAQKNIGVAYNEPSILLRSGLTQKHQIQNAVESNGEMALYFVLGDPTLQPNRNALEFHKTACLIWRMAGGAEFDDECCPYDDDGCTPVDYRSKSIEKWMDSSATLIIENVQ
ncbi:hypothetical protein BDEG_24970 [Batrachochytrium dendrobatidis JEL423]|uniref:HNH nuclease domain-containing protein n=1 Tax=Batrachochytrium dendrobatidis (strain JEL423) TaxID=403673 RepID=A0A177WMK6_BATDL|nr:hypothetical protein BDEG_24970 [Batrachochytrium dendrobatidis JEL423]